MTKANYWLVCAILTFLTISTMVGQAWFDIGLKAGIGPTLMFNQNIFDDNAYDHTLTVGNAFGAKFGFNFADNHGFTLDYMRATSRQDFEFEAFGQTNNTNDITWKHNDLILMYRYSGNGAFIEFGPKLSFVSEVNQEYLMPPELDVSDAFETQYTSLVFGFGSYLMGSDLWTLQAGIRLHWALDDMISESGMEDHQPTIATQYSPYKKTNAVAAQFGLEFNYAFGRFAKASCSDRWKLILFQ